ncbi:MAG: hypothetical protein S4CHLAM7_08760 [Chlamydiae bacterium]|nr:hypothetical protein [Chlamydiota bacterium]
MFAVIYRFKLKKEQEKAYLKSWKLIVDYFKKECGAIGSILHKAKDGLWLAYSCWPDKKTRDAAWPGKKSPNKQLPQEIQTAIKEIQLISEKNKPLEQYEEICMEMVENALF